MANTQSNSKVKVQLVRSLIGTRESHRATVRGLGLGRLNSVSELQDSPAVRGMINKVSYLVKVIGPALKQHGLAGEQINAVKVIKTGEIKRAVTLKGLTASAGARAAIEAVGGKVLEQV